MTMEEPSPEKPVENEWWEVLRQWQEDDQNWLNSLSAEPTKEELEKYSALDERGARTREIAARRYGAGQEVLDFCKEIPSSESLPEELKRRYVPSLPVIQMAEEAVIEQHDHTYMTGGSVGLYRAASKTSFRRGRIASVGFRLGVAARACEADGDEDNAKFVRKFREIYSLDNPEKRQQMIQLIQGHNFAEESGRRLQELAGDIFFPPEA